jgi:hypothetical protein
VDLLRFKTVTAGPVCVQVEGDEHATSLGSWSEAEAASFREWLRNSLGQDRVKEIKVRPVRVCPPGGIWKPMGRVPLSPPSQLSTRLTETPAVIVDHEPTIFRQ